MHFFRLLSLLSLFTLSITSSPTYAQEPQNPVTQLYLKAAGTVYVDYSNVQDNTGGSGFSQIRLFAKKDAGSWVNTGTTSNLSTGSLAYSVTGTDGTFSLSAEVTDAAGNKSTIGSAPSLVTVILDTALPTAATITAAATSNTATFSLNYSGAADTLSGVESVALWSKKSGGAWAATGATSATSSGSFSFTAPSDGLYYFRTVVTDRAGNSSATPTGDTGTQVTVAIDLCPADPNKTAPGLCGCGVVEDTGDSDGDGTINCLDTDGPTVVLSTTAPLFTKNSSIPVTVTFNRSVTGFTASDLMKTNSNISNFTGSGASYSFTLSPVANGEFTVNLPQGTVQDAINGRPNSASAVLSRTFDNVRPTLQLTSSAGLATNSSPIVVTATFSEDITGFTTADLSLANATVTNFPASSSGKTFTFNLVPIAEGAVSVTVNAGAVQDSATNTTLSATTLERTYDTTSPAAPGITIRK